MAENWAGVFNVQLSFYYKDIIDKFDKKDGDVACGKRIESL